MKKEKKKKNKTKPKKELGGGRAAENRCLLLNRSGLSWQSPVTLRSHSVIFQVCNQPRRRIKLACVHTQHHTHTLAPQSLQGQESASQGRAPHMEDGSGSPSWSHIHSALSTHTLLRARPGLTFLRLVGLKDDRTALPLTDRDQGNVPSRALKICDPQPLFTSNNLNKHSCKVSFHSATHSHSHPLAILISFGHFSVIPNEIFTFSFPI